MTGDDDDDDDDDDDYDDDDAMVAGPEMFWLNPMPKYSNWLTA